MAKTLGQVAHDKWLRLSLPPNLQTKAMEWNNLPKEHKDKWNAVALEVVNAHEEVLRKALKESEKKEVELTKDL